MVQVMACCLTAQSHYLSQWSMSNIWLRIHFYTPAPPKVEWGYTWFTPMSVHPYTMDMKNHLRTQITLYEEDKNYPIWRRQERRSKYAVQLASWQLRSNSPKTSVCRQGFRNFLKKVLAQFISYLAFTLMGWVSWPLFIFVFLASFLALWWPNIWPKMGFAELFEKTIGPIHFIPGIYPYGVSLLTSTHFRIPSSLIFGPLVAKYLAENGVSGTFWKNFWLNSFHTWYLFTLMGWVSWPLYIFVFLASFSALWWPNI